MSNLNFPSGWVETMLGSVLISVVGGGTPSRKVPAYFGGQIPWFTVKDMKALKPNDAEEHITEAAIADSATNLIPANTLIVATRIALGRAMRPTVACAINQDLKALVLGSGINSDFLLHWVGAHQRVIQDLGSGTTVSGIRLEALHGLPLLLPPAAEQTRIVAKLEELLSDLDAGVAELKAAQKKLAQYRQSLLKAAVEGALTAEWRKQRKTVRPEPVEGHSSAHGSTGSPRTDECETGAQLLQRILQERRARWEAKLLAKFKEQGKPPPKDWQKKYPEPVQPDTSDLHELPQGWVWVSMDQLTEFITSGSRGWADYYSDVGATFIRSQNINKDWLDMTDIAFVNPPQSAEGARTRVRKNDLLLTITGANVGKAAPVDIDIDEAYVSQHVSLIRMIEAELSGYLHAFLTSSAGGRGQLDKEAYGAGKPGLNLQQVAAVAVPLPGMLEIRALMDAVAMHLRSANDQEAAITESLKQSTAQRQNILRAAFSGQLVPQNPADEPASVLLARIRAERAAQGAVKKPRGRKAKEMA